MMYVKRHLIGNARTMAGMVEWWLIAVPNHPNNHNDISNHWSNGINLATRARDQP